MVERASSNLRADRGKDSSRLPDNSGAHPIAEKSVKLTISSEHPAVRAVQDQVLGELARFGFDHQSHFAVKLALEEALINAMKHGNKMDPGKKVHVEFKINRDQVEFIIEDEGPGFAREGVPDPTLDENIEKCSGRGILLIEAYMTRVYWSHGGRRLHMIKKNEADSQLNAS
jgi:serine/threonine-protein kinase RsbW